MHTHFHFSTKSCKHIYKKNLLWDRLTLFTIIYVPYIYIYILPYRYKLFRSLKHRLAHITQVMGGEWPASVHGFLSYSYPCEGCSKCWSPPPAPVWKWWHLFLPPRVEGRQNYVRKARLHFTHNHTAFSAAALTVKVQLI